MVEKKEKTISYRRAVWLDGVHGISLERCLRDAHSRLKTIDERTVIQAGQHKKSLNAKELSSGGFLMHITADTPGEYASVVPKAEPNESELDLTTVSPPADGEWLDGDAFIFVRHDHMCLCTTGIRDSAVASFLYEFFKKAEIRKDSGRFVLEKVADVSRLKMLRAQGVKEVVIKATTFKATLDYEKRRSEAFSIAGAAAKQFKAFIGKPNDYTRDGLQVNISLRSDHRFVKDFKLGEKRIEDVAADLVKNFEEEDDFVIITKTGQKIGPKEIFVRSKVLIDSDGKTVDRDKAWKALVQFFVRIRDEGVLEQ